MGDAPYAIRPRVVIRARRTPLGRRRADNALPAGTKLVSHGVDFAQFGGYTPTRQSFPRDVCVAAAGAEPAPHMRNTYGCPQIRNKHLRAQTAKSAITHASEKR